MKAAFFDLDKTVIAKSSMVALGPEFRSRGLLNRRTMLRAAFGHLMFQRFGADEQRMQKIRESVLKITRGWDRDEVRRLVRETINDVIEPLIYEEALDLIDHHREEGHEVWLVSSAPAEIVDPFAELLGLNGAIASRARVDAEGKFTGEMDFYNQGANKALAIRELAAARDIDLSDSFAYSDSETDAPMLHAVGHAYAVNPDRRLAQLAAENHWPRLHFTRLVTAKHRTRNHAPYVVSVILLGLAAVFGRARLFRG